MSTGDFEPAFRELLGEKAPLSASTIVRPKATWADDYAAWRERGLAAPLLAVGDGDPGSWAGLREVFPSTRHQRWGNDGICAAAPVNGLDQRGITRPQGVRCDSGAHETATGATYVSLAPARILATRHGTGLSGTFTSRTARTFAVAGVGDVPVGAAAVTGNLTVTNQTSAGFVSLTPLATNTPTTSTINVPVGAAGGATTAILLDVTGCFVP